MRITRALLAVLFGAIFALTATAAPAKAAPDVGTQATQFLGIHFYGYPYLYWDTQGFSTDLTISTQRDTATGKLNFRAHFNCHDPNDNPTPCKVTITTAQFRGRDCDPSVGCPIHVVGERTNWSISASSGSVFFIGTQHSRTLISYRSVAKNVKVEYTAIGIAVTETGCFDSDWAKPGTSLTHDGICQTV